MWWLAGGVAVAGFVLAALWQHLRVEQDKERERADRERERVTQANRAVAGKVETARVWMARRNYDEALRVLNDALANEHATRLDDARAVLAEARHGQAAALLDDAAIAIARRNVPMARQLLKDYLAHTYADQKARATLLLEDLARATADDHAMHLLAQLSDDELAAFADSGRLTQGESFTDKDVRDLYRDTLRRHLPKELTARAATSAAARVAADKLKRQQVEREERLRASPAFRELMFFAATVHKQIREESLLREQQQRALDFFFQQTGVNDPAEREKARQALRSGRDREDIALAVARKRAAVKKDYRQSPDYDRSDEETFDRLVDQGLDRLLADVAGGTGP
jgi:hypothetical protein